MVLPSSASPPGEPSWIRTRPPAVAPSLHRHYSDCSTTTSDSAPVPRIGTQVLVGSPLERLPSHRDDWFPQFRREAWIRLTPPARRTPWAAFRATPRLIPTVPPSVGFDVMSWFPTSQQWFTCVRLPDPHLNLTESLGPMHRGGTDQTRHHPVPETHHKSVSTRSFGCRLRPVKAKISHLPHRRLPCFRALGVIHFTKSLRLG